MHEIKGKVSKKTFKLIILVISVIPGSQIGFFGGEYDDCEHQEGGSMEHGSAVRAIVANFE